MLELLHVLVRCSENICRALQFGLVCLRAWLTGLVGFSRRPKGRTRARKRANSKFAVRATVK